MKSSHNCNSYGTYMYSRYSFNIYEHCKPAIAVQLIGDRNQDWAKKLSGSPCLSASLTTNSLELYSSNALLKIFPPLSSLATRSLPPEIGYYSIKNTRQCCGSEDLQAFMVEFRIQICNRHMTADLNLRKLKGQSHQIRMA